MPDRCEHAEGAGIGRSALVLGAGGFIGTHLARRLKAEGYWVRGVDLVAPAYAPSAADEFVIADLQDASACGKIFDRRFDEVYQLAADMGGAGYIFTGSSDWDILSRSTQITLNALQAYLARGAGRFFFASSACIYPRANQEDAANPVTREDSAYPADPDSDYGFEKLYGERLCLAAQRNRGLAVRIARYHNVFGPEGAWRGGREKVPAALCRKVAEAQDGGSLEIWGDGRQVRSFLYIDDCLDGTRRLMRSGFSGPVNIGSGEAVTIEELARKVMRIAGKRLEIVRRPGPQGVRARVSDNELARRSLGWAPSIPLESGLALTYDWVARQVAQARSQPSGIQSRDCLGPGAGGSPATD